MKTLLIAGRLKSKSMLISSQGPKGTGSETIMYAPSGVEKQGTLNGLRYSPILRETVSSS